MALVNASIFTITELGGDKRQLVLTGRALPYRPFELGTSQRLEQTWLPGVPEATVTVLGPKEDATTIQGYWKDRYLGATNNKDSGEDTTIKTSTADPMTLDRTRLDTCRKARDAVDSIVRSGQLLEVTWLDEKRRGFIQKFDKKWHNEHDLEWSIEFMWISRGEPTAPTAFITESDTQTVLGKLKNVNEELRSIQLPQIPLDWLQYLSVLSELANKIDSDIASLEDAISRVTLGAFTAVNAIKGIIAITTGITEECKTMYAFLYNTASDAISTTPKQDQTPEERIEAETWRREVMAQTRAVQSLAVQARESFLSSVQSDIAGKYVAREGDDLRDVSRVFYQTPFEWRRILIFNQLQSAELVAGQIVLVPRISVQASYGVND